MQVAAQVGEVDQLRQGAGEGRLDLAAILAQLGLDEREAEEGVGLGFRGECPELRSLAR